MVFTARTHLLPKVGAYLELCPQSSKYVSALSDTLFIVKTTLLVTIAFRYRPAALDLVRIQYFDRGSVRPCLRMKGPEP